MSNDTGGAGVGPCAGCVHFDTPDGGCGDIGMDWIDARKTLPPPSEWPTRYLVILDTESPAQHCKDWAGRGDPEIATYCSQWKPYPWNARGSLSVAYWMPMPVFAKRWDKTVDGQPGRWIEIDQSLNSDTSHEVNQHPAQ